MVLGLTAVPGAGDTFLAAADDRTVRQIAEQRQARRRAARFANSRGRATLETLMEQLKEGEKTSLNLVLKGDVSGSVEALEDALFKLDIPERGPAPDHPPGRRRDHRERRHAGQRLVRGGHDHRLQRAGLRTRSGEIAEREGVEIRYYTVIYQAIEEIEAALKGLLKPEYEEVELGSAEIRDDLPLVQGRQHRRLYRPLRASSAATPRRGCCATGRSWPTTSRSARSSGSRTTSPRSARASSAV